MRYIFGECRLETESRQFSRHGQAVRLSPKAFDLLCLLIQHRPRVLNKAELMEALWPGTFVVEANLPVIVGELRSALGERSSASSSIKTHHRIGYSFASDVREQRSTNDDAEPNAPRLGLQIARRRILLGVGANSIGRDTDCDVCVNDASVSRHHAQIVLRDGGAWLEDLASKNGTFHKGTRLKELVKLTDGDEITFGVVKALFFVAPTEKLSTLTL